ncbi:MAG: YraN family protein [Thiohalocapsa sp.]
MFGRQRDDARRTGEAKEGVARLFLETHGLRHVAHNVHCRHGEIDLVMRDDQTLVFVEVRYRRNERFGGALASVDRRKQRRLIATAGYYLQRHPTNLPCRFDVVAIGSGDQVEWIQNAFDGAAS